MITTDSLIRRIEFIGDNFFNNVEVRDASRYKSSYIHSKIELKEYLGTPYFKEGVEAKIFVEDKTPNRLREERFLIGFEGSIFYRGDLKKLIRITLGNDFEASSFREDLKRMQKASNSHCGTYYISLQVPIPENLSLLVEPLVDI